MQDAHTHPQVDSTGNAAERILKTVSKEVQSVSRTDNKVVRTIGRAVADTVSAGQHALGAGANKLTSIITAPFNGGKTSPGGAAADKQLAKAINTVGRSTHDAAQAVQKAAEARSGAVSKTLHSVSRNVERAADANAKAKHQAATRHARRPQHAEAQAAH
jgi:hypothetical protein